MSVKAFQLCLNVGWILLIFNSTDIEDKNNHQMHFMKTNLSVTLMQLITGWTRRSRSWEIPSQHAKNWQIILGHSSCVLAIHFLCNKWYKTTLISSASLLQTNERNLLRKVIFCNKFEWFYNNLFLFILEVSFLHRVSSPFLNSSSIELIDGKWEKVSIVECAGSTHRVLVLTLLSFRATRSIRDYRWTLTAKRSSFIVLSSFVESPAKRSTASMWRKKHILMQFSMDERHKRGKTDLLPACLIVDHIMHGQLNSYLFDIERKSKYFWASAWRFPFGRRFRCWRCIFSIRSAPDRINHRLLSSANKTRQVIKYCWVFWGRFWCAS